MKEVVILSAKRTPIGKFKGAFKETSAVMLGTIAVEAAINDASIEPTEVDQVILGNVLQAGNGQNPARQVAIHAGVPQSSPAMTINQVCGSGLKSVILGAQAIQLGQADTVVVGGIENMSQSPLLYDRSAKDNQFDEARLIDSMISDGLTDAFSKKHMGTTAEAVAQKYQISRVEQDSYANQSQQRATIAQNNGSFAEEIVPVQTPAGLVELDQGVRPTSTPETLAKLNPVFAESGTVTAGNSSTINDGAAALVLMSKDLAEEKNLPYLATLGNYSEIGNDPQYMGYAPYYAIKTLLEKNQQTIEDIDLFEINEAFASQSIAVAKDLNLPSDKVNVWGGAIALGHPIGASGARILTTLVHGLKRENKKTGIASLCVGGGIGLAVTVTRP